jgi:hypothetical protein
MCREEFNKSGEGICVVFLPLRLKKRNNSPKRKSTSPIL